ncbi:carbohydrate ABC transporter permease [Neobacillus sp. OS1-2]|uniref:carbohydrate ABC transporter permease n=1 Tax=Neobacillus sp. OS1-2 TaxID=3070680 RepID=UPI0027DF6B17|nr:carbohydrate ABC transporter permease [Neobacillus sp. OS1-2]WML41485.1 carbohydrate ABC transporter permease [Neobacillus sp. OS1-2]
MIDKKRGISANLVTIFMWIYSFVIVGIIGYLIYNSLRSRSDILSNTMGKPQGLSFENYLELFVKDHFENYFLNSVIILILSIFLLTFLSSMVAYGLGRYKFRLNKAMRVFFLLGMMFPVQLGIVPIFLLMQDLNLVNTYTSVVLILGTAISMPVFMLTDFFAKLPNELYEAAIIDGGGEWRIFLQIMFPLAKPVVFAVCIVTSVQIWNQFFIPLIFLQSEENKTIPLLVVKYTNQLFNNMDLALAASVMSTVPILILFVIFSKRILDGFASGGVKG